MISKIFNFLKSNYKTILKVVFGLFLLYYIIYFLTPSVKMGVEQKKQLDSLNVLVKQLHEDNIKLENKISDFNSEIDQVDKNIQGIKGQKTIIKEIYHEKISAVDKLTVDEIDSFFANRYK